MQTWHPSPRCAGELSTSSASRAELSNEAWRCAECALGGGKLSVPAAGPRSLSAATTRITKRIWWPQHPSLPRPARRPQMADEENLDMATPLVWGWCGDGQACCLWCWAPTAVWQMGMSDRAVPPRLHQQPDPATLRRAGRPPRPRRRRSRRPRPTRTRRPTTQPLAAWPRAPRTRTEPVGARAHAAPGAAELEAASERRRRAILAVPSDKRRGPSVGRGGADQPKIGGGGVGAPPGGALHEAVRDDDR